MRPYIPKEIRETCVVRGGGPCHKLRWDLNRWIVRVQEGPWVVTYDLEEAQIQLDFGTVRSWVHQAKDMADEPYFNALLSTWILASGNPEIRAYLESLMARLPRRIMNTTFHLIEPGAFATVPMELINIVGCYADEEDEVLSFLTPGTTLIVLDLTSGTRFIQDTPYASLFSLMDQRYPCRIMEIT